MPDMHTVETARLFLRPFTSDDLDALASLNADADVMRYIGDGKPQTKAQTQTRLNAILGHWRQHGFGLRAIVDKATHAFIGFCGLQFLENTSEIEIGYRIARRFWRMGIATEAARACLRHGFEILNLSRIVAVVHPENLPSQRVVEKIGLCYVKNSRFYNTELRYYEITRERFKSNE
jgi:RimJ/RimL family protein N-acetyltransferase